LADSNFQKVGKVRVHDLACRPKLAELELAGAKVGKVRVGNSAPKAKLAKLELAILSKKQSWQSWHPHIFQVSKVSTENLLKQASTVPFMQIPIT
jgi:hypothetical protein